MSIVGRAFILLCFFSAPFTAHADDSFLVWGTGSARTTITDGGTYALPIDVPAPAYIETPPVAGYFGFHGVLYRIIDPGPEEYRGEEIAFINPDDPAGDNEAFAWPAAGVYELEIIGIGGVEILMEDALPRWAILLLLGQIAHAQGLPPPPEGSDTLAVLRFTIEDEGASAPDPVIVIPGILGSRLKDNVWTLDPVLHTYDNLVETLAGNGYVYDQTLFTFPYDWTQSNETTAEELKAKLDAVKAQTGAPKVDLVAHSMGGLVAREYVQSPGYEGDVDQLIFLGTPHLGAPLAYLMYEGGETDRTLEGFFFSLYLDHLAHEAGFANAFDYLHLGHVVSVRQLLPVYDYLFDETNDLLDYPDGYPTNPFLEGLSSASDQLALSGVEITNFIGDDGGNGTLNSLNVKPSTELPRWLHGAPARLNRGAGDGTVPLFSAAPSLIDSSVTLDSDHTSLPTEAEGLVYSILTGETATFLADVPLVKRFLVLRAFSPIDIQITAPSGLRVGKDFDTGREFDEIPGAFYSGFGTDIEYVVIPNPEDGQYVITAQGTGSGGAYTLSTSYIGNTESAETNISSTIERGAITQAVATLDTTSGETVVVQQSLADLIASLKAAIGNLEIPDKQKSRLLKKAGNIEKKRERQVRKQSKVLSQLNAKIQKKAEKGKIDTNAAAELLSLLDDLIAEDTTVPLDESLLDELEDKINALDVKRNLKNLLLRKVERLENLSALNRSVENMIKVVKRKKGKGKLSEMDAKNVLDILAHVIPR